MRVLVCGDRKWDDAWMIHVVLRGIARTLEANGGSSADLYVIDGGAKGADRIAGDWRDRSGADGKTYPANWTEHHRAAGPIRNQQMLTEGQPDVVFAFHDNLAESKGTADMVRRATKARVSTFVIGHSTGIAGLQERIRELEDELFQERCHGRET
jgi:hypothetical protein